MTLRQCKQISCVCLNVTNDQGLPVHKSACLLNIDTVLSNVRQEIL